MKFQTFQEEMWWKGSLIGLGVVLGVLDLVRVVMMTLVELRKYENRRKAKDGHFLPRKIKRENDKDYQP
ncbi:HERC2, partial [Symbiodinium pilosum]